MASKLKIFKQDVKGRDESTKKISLMRNLRVGNHGWSHPFPTDKVIVNKENKYEEQLSSIESSWRDKIGKFPVRVSRNQMKKESKPKSKEKTLSSSVKLIKVPCCDIKIINIVAFPIMSIRFNTLMINK